MKRGGATQHLLFLPITRSIGCGALVLWTCVLGRAASGDEATLRVRASQFYQLQIAGKRSQAALLVEPKTRDLFLNGKAVPYISSKVNRVQISGSADAEVEVTVELMLPMFPRPVSRTFPTPWKKIGGKWYFVVDTSAVQFALSQGKAPVPEAKPALSAMPSVVFGQDGEIQKSLRLENNSRGPVRFRVTSLDSDWLEVKNRGGDIPAGESFPLVIVLKQIPTERQKLLIGVEGIEPDQRMTRLEIRVEVEVPNAAFRTDMERAIRIYRAEQ